MGVFKRRKEYMKAEAEAVSVEARAVRESRAYAEFVKWAEANGFVTLPGSETQTVPFWRVAIGDIEITIYPVFTVGKRPVAVEHYSLTLYFPKTGERTQDNLAPQQRLLQEVVDHARSLTAG